MRAVDKPRNGDLKAQERRGASLRSRVTLSLAGPADDVSAALAALLHEQRNRPHLKTDAGFCACGARE